MRSGLVPPSALLVLGTSACGQPNSRRSTQADRDREETLIADINLADARRNRSINGFNHVLRDRRADLYGDLGSTGTR
jgi:predicted amidohydrolase